MKKVLFATTALVATAGMASAEVALSGSAEIGVIGGDIVPTEQFHGDIDVTFTMSGETDNGLTFGASIDLDESDGSNATCGVPTIIGTGCVSTGASPAFGNTTQGGETAFISGGFGTVTLGDTDGALDWAMQEVNLVGGSINDDETTHAGFNGNAGLDGSNDGQILRYDYSFGAFGVAVSAEIDDTGTGDDVFGIGAKYDADLGGITLGFGVGYQDGGTTFGDIWGVSVDADFGNGFLAGVNYSDMSLPAAAGSVEFIGVGVGYTTGAIGIGVNYGEYDGPGTGSDADGFGLAATYDLGGGAQIQLGYGSSSVGAAPTVDQWSLGVAMSF